LKIVEELLKYGTDVNVLCSATYEKGYLPLHVAIKNKQEEVAKLLKSYGSDVNAQDGYEKPPIFYAAQNGDFKITKLLLTNKANVKDNPELLNVAVMKECREIVEVLLEHGVAVNSTDECGRTALHFTALSHDRTFLLHKDPDINVKGEIAKLLLSWGANVNAQTKKGVTTLHFATQEGYVKVVEALLEHNADVNCKCKTDITPLHIAAQKDHLEVVEVLLKFGAIIDSKDEYGRTALHIASNKKHEQIVRALLEYGSDINIMCDSHKVFYDTLDVIEDDNYESVYYDLVSHNDEYGQYKHHNYSHDSDDDYRDCYNHFDSDDYDDYYDHYDSDDYYNFYNGPDADVEYYCGPSTTSNFGIIDGILKRHIVKMKTANLFVSEKHLRSISSDDEMSDFQKECEEEIARMKSENVSNANVSFYDILTKDVSQLAIYAGNESIVQILRSNDYRIKFPIYARLINSNFRKGERRKELLEQGYKIFHFLYNNFPQLPHDCTEKIFSYLSDEDLRILIGACKPITVSSPNTDINNVVIT